MKRITIVLLITLAVMLISPFGTVQAAELAPIKYSATKVSTPMKIDGNPADWSNIPVAKINLTSPLGLDNLVYHAQVQVAYDTNNAYFLVQVTDEYRMYAPIPSGTPFTDFQNHNTSAIGLAFPINATVGMHMGAPSDKQADLTKSTGTVDIAFWQLQTKHGVQAGGINSSYYHSGSGSGFGGLDNMWANNPYVKNVDNNSKSGNMWLGAWSFSSGNYVNGSKGNWIFEYKRPLVTNNTLDAQWKVGGMTSLALAYWDPDVDPSGWNDPTHHTSNQMVDIYFGPLPTTKSGTPGFEILSGLFAVLLMAPVIRKLYLNKKL